MKTRSTILLFLMLLIGSASLSAQPIFNKDGIQLKHIMTAEEAALYETVDVYTMPTDPPVGNIRPVAEYEPSEAVLVRYPFGIPISLIKEMAEDVKVITIVSNASQQNTVLSQYQSNNVNTANCEFLIHASDSYWTRDYGPWFIAIDNAELAVFDFTYNRPRYNDNAVNTALCQQLSIDRYASDIESAGGNYMCDGKSEAASTDLILEENTNYTEEQVRQLFEDYLGVEYYHIMQDPLQDYIKHIDCWGKYLAPNKVMIGQVPQSDSRYALFEAAANYFAAVTCPWGTPYEVYRVYTPGAQGWGASTPYTNSLILNKKVFVALTGNANDAAAIASYQAAMPGYEIIGVNYDSWEDTDALHCRTHEITDRGMLFIKHQPIFGEVQNTGSLTISTELYSYCDSPMVEDSVIAYVKTAGGNYTAYQMSNTTGNTWEVEINGLPSGEIDYYLFAKDASGRRENHPYIGAPDPHTFTLTGSSTPMPVMDLDKTQSQLTANNIETVEDEFIISNTGLATLEFDINIEDAEWLSVTPSSANLEPNENITITISCNISGLENGNYQGLLNISNNSLIPEIDYNVNLNVHNTAVIELNKNEINFNINAPGTYEDVIIISNNGFLPLNYNIANVQYSNNPPYNWLTINSEEGSVNPDGTTDLIFTANIENNSENFNDVATVTLTSNAENNPSIEITVSINYIVGIQQFGKADFSFYPNPTSGILEISIDDVQTMIGKKIVIYSIIGEKVLESAVADSKTILDISRLSNGVYLIKIENTTKKIFKQ
ncbi:MAG: agmatine deiminase family protein [Bacteroidales bacterium]|jgi:agmatine deiminase|nr:agmatine deiminase family protein [Bacteroidales bacterium]MDD2203765.1 agmatine deiminase family protein [Bacteroidales bacterium]MDD3151601.1 agmatine deiminase family protein [Bacteroidales bacterium]MDD3913296.1 agmatine deiminase family protein [Bacteroidales bacterium]MDD4633327.1 agmatine deiminase family protein [Bacteroidales bacterium]